ncbi:MAG: hypothetical protein ACQEXX_11865 [Bacillota bacterium]
MRRRNPVLKLILFIVVGILLIPTFFIARSFGVFQKEMVLTKYKLAVEEDGKLYDAWPLFGSFAAVDKRGDDRTFYYRIEDSSTHYLFQLAYGKYETVPSKENPFLAGNARYDMDAKFVEKEKEYTNANDYTETYVFYNKQKEPVYRYNPEDKADKAYIKSIIAAGMTRNSVNGGSSAAKDPYLNVTRLFRDKLEIEVKVELDEENKLAILSMEPLK